MALSTPSPLLVGAEVVDRNDVGVVELAGDLRLLHESSHGARARR
jgi:hypothetical protein